MLTNTPILGYSPHSITKQPHIYGWVQLSEGKECFGHTYRSLTGQKAVAVIAFGPLKGQVAVPGNANPAVRQF